jgi:DNA-binding NarL/FixJ family response regulator
MTDRSVLIASADRLYAEAASARIDDEPGWSVAGTVSDGLQALASMARAAPQAILVIGELPRLGPAALARQVRRRWPGVTVALLGEASSEDAVSLGPDATAEDVLTALAAPPVTAPEEEAAPEPDVILLGRLTRRERTVLKFLAEGRGMPEIARTMGVSEHTVRTHMQNLYAKLGAHSRLDVVRFAAKHGLVETDDGADDGADQTG